MLKKLLLLVLLAATCSTVVVAQDANETAGNETDAPPSVAPENETVIARIDRISVVTDYWVTDGTLHIEVYSNGGNELTVTETTSEDGATQVALVEEWVPRGRYVMTVDLVRTDSWSVLITTRLSLQNERGTKLSESGDALVAGPFDGSDVRDAGIGSALGVSIGVLYTAVKAKVGAGERGEHVA